MRLFGWSADEVLKMPAIRFFALMEEGRKQARIERAINNVALCDISSISLGNAEYFEKLRKVFYDQAISDQKRREKPAMNPVDPMTVALVENLTLEASRLN